MEGLTIAILVITLFSGVLYSWRNRQGNDALASVAGDFPLTPEKAARIAVEAGLSWRERTLGRTVPVVRTRDGLKVEIGCRAGVMAFEVSETPVGSRVAGHAEEVAVVRLPELGGLGASSTNVLYLRAGTPRNPAKLLRRRERVFRALARAASRGERRIGKHELRVGARAGRDDERLGERVGVKVGGHS
ncbi:hypothetical protein [Sphaerisporangium perillae]|uniref:hypothetical protein n=1 Tax=Sphaerisporangium perillae TaxID=2935860 RepID=UPI00200D6832|nr:hypothetical protein [Sphaerisporangium perillae]